jgi:predicted nuclease of predicted toxin-antitoxin system
MRLLLDESLPRKLRHRLAPHEVRTVPEMGWAGKTNGVLLQLAEQEFDVFLTADQKLPDQQNLPTFRIAIVVFAAVSNRLRDIEPLVPKALEILVELGPGAVIVLR